LANIDSLKAVYEDALKAFGGRIDILVNNGGVSMRSESTDTSMSVENEIMTVDYVSCVALSKLVLPSMMKRKSGHIANVSRFVISFCWLRCLFTSPLWCMVLFSLAGIVATPLRSAYCGAKSGLMGYFNAVRLEQFAHDTDVVVSEKVLLGFDCFDRIGVNHRSLVSPRHTLNFLFSRSQIYAPELLKHRSV
jgi:NAD(P)-dependent dehydrogenase (short-subunit alcohol dehydrogenase family)